MLRGSTHGQHQQERTPTTSSRQTGDAEGCAQAAQPRATQIGKICAPDFKTDGEEHADQIGGSRASRNSEGIDPA